MSRWVCAAMLWLVPTAALAADATRPGVTAPYASRIVSLNPSLTAVLVALGAGDTLVGVDEFSARQQPGLRNLPRVGGLYDPSLEAVVALRPDLVVLVPSVQQRDFRARLAELKIDVLELDPVSFEEVLGMIETLGARVGRAEAARARVAAIRSAKAEAERAAEGRPRPRAVLVLQREPLFVVGSGSFIDDMLRAAGAENLGAQLGQPYPRASLEWLVAARPELILDSSAEPGDAKAFWSRWPSLPAVSNDRIVTVAADVVTLPGPQLDRALRVLGAAVISR